MPKIKPGQIWIYKINLASGIQRNDVLVKVLYVTDTSVHTMCKTDFGFTDLKPRTYRIAVFLDCLLLLK